VSRAACRLASAEFFSGDRETIRRQAVIHALLGLISLARNMP
jgi:nicotinamide mononucleotide (NMN) deamidase PncC